MEMQVPSVSIREPFVSLWWNSLCLKYAENWLFVPHRSVSVANRWRRKFWYRPFQLINYLCHSDEIQYLKCTKIRSVCQTLLYCVTDATLVSTLCFFRISKEDVYKVGKVHKQTAVMEPIPALVAVWLYSRRCYLSSFLHKYFPCTKYHFAKTSKR